MATRAMQSRIARQPPYVTESEETLIGHALVGREVNLLWEDKKRYDAVVVRYFPQDDEYKLVYLEDEGVEIAKIDDREWVLKRKRLSTKEHPVLTGAIIEFVYPLDQQRYRAMVYGHSDDCEQLKICYLDDHSTDCIGGRGWDYITDSPCAIHVDTSPVLLKSETPDDIPDEHLDDAPLQHVTENEHVEQQFISEPVQHNFTGMVQQSRVARAAASAVRATRAAAAAAATETKKGRVSKRKPWLK